MPAGCMPARVGIVEGKRLAVAHDLLPADKNIFYSLNDNWQAEDRRKLLAFARDLLNSDYAGHRLTFVQFAQSPHFAHLNAVYNAFDFSGPLEFVKKAAGLSDRVDTKAR